MSPSKKRKVTRVTSGLTLLLIIFTSLIPFSHATQWSPDTRVTWQNTIDSAPSITQAKDGTIWIVWHSFEIGVTNPDVLYKTYNGSSTFSWSQTNKLTTDPNTDKTSSITAAGNNIWVVWSSNRDGNYEIYYKTYNGTSWTPDTRLTTNSSKDEFPSIMQDKDGNIWVVWSSNRDGNYEIYYKTYNGTSWTPDTRLIANPDPDWDPSIMQAQDGKIWVAWTRNDDLYYKVLQATKIGEDIQINEVVPDTQLTPTDPNIDWHPSITQTQDGKIRIAWDSLKVGMDIDIYSKIYDGASWSEERITYNSKDDVMPAIMQASDGTIWVTWASDRLDNWDIYYKTDPPSRDLHDIAIISIIHEPNRIVAFQGLTFSIWVVPQNYGMEYEQFQVTTYVNSTIIGAQTVGLSPGQLMPINFIWNTTTVNPGNYVIRAEASIVPGEIDTTDNTLFNGIIQVRIPGDADFSGIVELFDFVLWAYNFGRTYEELSLSEYPDFDNNGYVELSDFWVWKDNFGREYR